VSLKQTRSSYCRPDWRTLALVHVDYDAITTSPIPDAPPDFHTTLFPVTDDSILPGAQKLVDQLKKQHYYTDTANFDLRCQVCKVGLKGETGARQHAMQ
jgi:ubiquitin thioesterase OTU1